MSSHRELMPTCAAWLDDLRSAFGAECINASIRAGMAGDATFYASEAGHELGNPKTRDPGANAYVFTEERFESIRHELAVKAARENQEKRR